MTDRYLDTRRIPPPASEPPPAPPPPDGFGRAGLVAELEAANAAALAARRELKALQDSERTEVLKLQAELASARQELDLWRRDGDATLPHAATVVDRLARELAACDSTVAALQTILRSDPNPPGRVIETHERWLCEDCGGRYGADYPDHTCRRLTPVTVTITRRLRSGGVVTEPIGWRPS